MNGLPDCRQKFCSAEEFLTLRQGPWIAAQRRVRHADLTAVCAGAIFLSILTGPLSAARDSTGENPAAPQTAESGGVVTTTPWVNGLITEGMANSPTFSGIATQLLESNVIATVEPALQIKTGLSGYMAFITRTPLRRYVRIYFNPKLQRYQAIAIIGHELSHALEVAMHPEVVNQSTLRAMYTQVGHGEGDRWDSEGAILAGRTILHELTTPAAAVNADDGR